MSFLINFWYFFLLTGVLLLLFFSFELEFMGVLVGLYLSIFVFFKSFNMYFRCEIEIFFFDFVIFMLSKYLSLFKFLILNFLVKNFFSLCSSLLWLLVSMMLLMYTMSIVNFLEDECLMNMVWLVWYWLYSNFFIVLVNFLN